jgi:outer membrane protein assembly factor BamD (BamD/ComL family)
MRLAGTEPNPRNQIAYYRALVTDHPASPLAPQAQFMAGFVLADELQEYEGAREELEKMISQYPDDELVASARWMLENMGEGLADQDQMRQIRQQVSTGGSEAP